MFRRAARNSVSAAAGAVAATAFSGTSHGQDSAIVPTGYHIAAEIASLTTIVGWFASILPSIATLMAIVWYGVMFYDTWRKRRQTHIHIPEVFHDDGHHDYSC